MPPPASKNTALGLELAHDPGRIPCHDNSRWYILGDYAAGSYHTALAYRHALQDQAVHPNKDVVFNEDRCRSGVLWAQATDLRVKRVKVSVNDGSIRSYGDVISDRDSFGSAEHSAGHGEIGADFQMGSCLPGAQDHGVVWREWIGTQRRTQSQARTKAHPASPVPLDDGNPVEAPTATPGNTIHCEKQPHSGINQPTTELVPDFPWSIPRVAVHLSVLPVGNHTLIYCFQTIYYSLN